MKKRIISTLAVVLVVAMLSVVLVACGAPETIADGKAKVQEKGYAIDKVSDIGGIIGVETNMFSYKKVDNGKEYKAFAVFYDTKEKAEAAFQDQKAAYDKSLIDYNNEIESLKGKIKSETDETKKAEMKEDLKKMEDYKKNYKIKQSGNWIVSGHKKAISALI